MYKPKIYLSGGFRSNWQEKLIQEFHGQCIIFNPRAHFLENHNDYWAWDIHFVNECDILFAYMESENPSGFGLTLEIGLAYGLGKTIILVDEKSKSDEKFEKYFRIVKDTADASFENLIDGINFLKKFTSIDKSIT
jgi:nucleoside 2-deoxyribosyltransferase